MGPFFIIFRMGEGAANFGKLLFSLIVLLIIISVFVSACTGVVHGITHIGSGPSQGEKDQAQCYADQKAGRITSDTNLVDCSLITR